MTTKAWPKGCWRTWEGLFSEVTSQIDANNTGKQLAQEDHFHSPDIPLQLKLNAQKKKHLTKYLNRPFEQRKEFLH